MKEAMYEVFNATVVHYAHVAKLFNCVLYHVGQKGQTACGEVGYRCGWHVVLTST